MKTKQNTFNTLNIVTTAMLCAVCVILSAIFHYLKLGSVGALFSPMHLPVFLAGILCGPWLGLICGVVSPLMAFLVSGGSNPSFPDKLIPMIVELAIYGFLSGLLRRVFLKNPKTNKFSSILALVISMVAGRIPAAFISAIFMSTQGEAYFAALWTSLLGKFTSTWAGIIIQIVFIPLILLALQKSGVLIKYLPVNIVEYMQKHDKQQAAEPPEEQQAEAQLSTADKPAENYKEQNISNKDV